MKPAIITAAVAATATTAAVPAVLANRNVGFTERAKWLHASSLEMFGPIQLDLESCNKFLPNKLGLNLKLHRSQSQWVLLGTETDDQKVYRISIDLAELHVLRLRLRCADLRHLENSMSRTPARFEYIHTSMTAITFPTEATKLECVINTGALPRKSCVVFLSQKAYNGSYSQNPFHFTHNHVRSISYDFNGNTIPKANQSWAFSAPFSYSQPYFDLLNIMAKNGIEHSTLQISPEEFKSGYGFFCQILQADYDPNYAYKSTPTFGTLTLRLDLKEKVSTPFMVLIFLDHEKRMLIDKSMDVRIE